MKRTFTGIFLFFGFIALIGCIEEENSVQPEPFILEEGVGDYANGLFARESESVFREELIRKMLITYITNPTFSHPGIIEQITGAKAWFYALDREEDMLYLVISANNYTEDYLEKLSVDPDRIEFGRTSDGHFSGRRVKLGNYELREPGNYFIRFPVKDLSIDRAKRIVIPFQGVHYINTLSEMKAFFYNHNLYGGKIRALVDIREDGTKVFITNYGAFVARKGEPSLTRLAQTLTKNASSREEKAQFLLDFVTKQIEYNQEKAHSGRNIVKRPNEVLMSGRSICGGKSVLYASLLEQLEIDYKFLYYEDHISVAVAGDYINYNGLSLKIYDNIYSLAETTAYGFQIGYSNLKQAPGIEHLLYVQRPGEKASIYEVKTGEPLPFG